MRVPVAVQKIQLKSIQLESLDADCLFAVNRCVRHIRQNHQKVLKLQDADILPQISKLTRQLNDSELSLIYKDLKDKILLCIYRNGVV